MRIAAVYNTIASLTANDSKMQNLFGKVKAPNDRGCQAQQFMALNQPQRNTISMGINNTTWEENNSSNTSKYLSNEKQ